MNMEKLGCLLKKATCWMVVFSMLCSFAPAKGWALTTITNSGSVSGSNYSSAYASKLDDIFQGRVSLFSNTTAKYPLGSSVNNSTQYKVAGAISGYQCYIYAQAVYYYLFGDLPYHGDGYKYWSNSDKVLTNQATASYELFKNAGVGFGAYVRTTNKSDGSYNGNAGHSFIILSYDSSGITYLEGNANGNGLIRITNRTWSEFNSNQLSGNGRRISHIVQCRNAMSYSTFDVNGYLDGAVMEHLSNYGTFDVWINGTLVADNVNDYCVDWPVGTPYEITDIQATGIHKYLGLREGSLSGTVGEGNTGVRLQFRTIDNIGDDFYAYMINNENGSYVYNQWDHNVTKLPFAANALEEIWHFQRLEDGTYKITSAWDGYALDVENFGNTPGTNVSAVEYKANTAQHWCIFQEEAGCVLSAVCTPCVLYGNSSTTNVQMENDRNENAAQWFQIVPVSETSSWDVNGFIDGKETAGIDGYGTFDIWLDGVQVADDVPDFFNGGLKIGTKYEIRDIRVKDGRSYNGVYSGSLSGTICGSNCFTLLNFSNAQANNVGEPEGEATLNGRKYVYYPGKVSWYTAKAFCEEKGGHLVTVTSAEEEELVQTLCADSNIWLGGTDAASEGNWVWITGEAFEYSNWMSDEPNNAAENNERNENYLMTYTGGWNDIYGSNTYGFVCEFEQGELKLGGYLDGQLQDSIAGYGTVDVYIDGTLVADDVSDYSAYVSGDGAYKICDIKPAKGYSYNGIHAGAHTGTVDWKTVSVVLEFTTIQTENIGEPDSVVEWNGKTYAYYSEPVTWYTANAFCNNAGGHLVTITDSQENDLVQSMLGENQAWAGGTDAESEQQWQWITGENFEYQAWRQSTGEPNNAPSKQDADENYLLVETEGWNDTFGCCEAGFILEIEPGTLEVNGYLNGQQQDSISGYGTVDVYVDGTLVADDVSDYSDYLTGGSAYEICDVKPADGYSYNGIYAGGRTGTVKGNDVAVVLEFTTVQTDNIGEAASVIEWNGKTYAYYTEPVTWYSAKTICEKLGGHLVTINDEAENNLVQILCEGVSVWAGGTDSAQEQEWRWVTDEAFEYELWLSGEPNNIKNDDEDGEDFITLTSGGWNDVEGCRELPFICEFEEKIEDDLEPVIPTLTLKSPTLEFKDMICINAFYTAENTEDVVEMGMITYNEKVSEWSVETADYVIPGATYVESSGRYYSSSQGIHAKYLADTVYLACYAKLTDGSYVYSKLAPYSPITYANSQLKNSTDAKLKQLVVAMLNYGAEAQLYFGHNTVNLANASLTDEQKALPDAYRADMVSAVPAAPAQKQGVFTNNAGFSSRKPAISFEGAFCINYFFTPKYAPVDGITLYYWNQADYNAADVLTVENASGMIVLDGTGIGEYRGDFAGISAKNLSEAVYVAAVYSDGTTTWTSGVLGYSIGAYCASQASKGGDVAALAETTAIYGYHAKQYFN